MLNSGEIHDQSWIMVNNSLEVRSVVPQLLSQVGLELQVHYGLW